MPVEGVNGILNVESSALHAPQVGVANTNPQHILTVTGNVVAEGLKLGFTPPSISRLSPLLGTSPRTRFNSITPRQGS